MADQETKDAIQSTALAVVEQQQTIVGGALVGASGAAALTDGGSQSQFDILEQLRDLQLRAVRGISEVANKLGQMLSFDKDEARRQREDATELAKEQRDMAGGDGVPQIEDDPEAQEKAGKLTGLLAMVGGFLGGLPGAGFIKKIFAPILGFFGKGGFLVKLFGRFGPLGALILGFTLVYKYSDEIAKALAPALEKIKELLPKLKPVMDFLLKIGDFLIKNILEGIGNALSYVIDAVTRVVDGFKMLFDGDILGGLGEIFGGLFDFILAIPKAVLETVGNILSPLASAVGEFFTNLYNDIVSYVTDVVTGIGDWFVSLKDSIVNFFVTAYNNAKTQITNDINGMLSFVSDIFTTVYDAIAGAVTAVKDFVVGIPDRIMSFVSSMFDPIVNFFSSIGTTIKNAINGIIDSLPLPDFIKNKVKFDTTPTDTQIAEGSAELANQDDQTGAVKGKSIVTQIAENKDKIQAYAEARGLPFDLEGTMLMNRDLAPNEKPVMMFGNSNYSDMISLNNLENLANEIKSGNAMTAQEQMKAEKGDMKVTMKDLPAVKESATAPVVIQKGGDTNTQVAQAKTDIHSGKLDTGVDSYHDRHAFAGAT